MNLARQTTGAVAPALLLGLLAACATSPQSSSRCGLAQPLPDRLLAARTIMVGEIHGSEEMPAIVAKVACELLREGKTVMLGLEMPNDLATELRTYLQSDGGADAVARLTQPKHWARGDGRGSRAMLRLIERVRQWRASGLPVDVEGFDVMGVRANPREQERALMARRDRLMAERANALARPGTTLILLAGNVHAIKYVDEAPFKGVDRMAALMNPPPDVSIALEHRGGTQWGCDRSGCGAHEQKPYYSDPALDGRIVLERQKGYDGVAFVGRLTASPPAREP